jgi:hypothetical protein
MARMSNKDKAMVKVSVKMESNEKRPVHIMLCISEKNIDGKTQKAYSISGMGMEDKDAIFTDKQMFLDELAKRVDEKPKGEIEDEDSESED